MNIGNAWVFDAEADGLNPSLFYCLTAQKVGTNSKHTTTKYDSMRKLFENADVVIGHNIIRYDKPHLERVLGIEIKAVFIDTLALSFYLEPKRPKHGLESYGEELGVPKPKIDNWFNMADIEKYKHRCETDVEINMRLWRYQYRRLIEIYGTWEKATEFLEYLMFKMHCAAEQEKSKWLLDQKLCSETLERLEIEQEEKVKALSAAMPKVPVFQEKSRPKVMYKKDGSLSVHGSTWAKLLEANGLPLDYEGTVRSVKEYSDPNPGSTQQVKAWLDSFGWVPKTFKYQRDKITGDIKKIPQIRDDKTGEICSSIQDLYEKEPSLEVLEGLSILKHRIPMLRGFLNSMDEDGFVYAGIQGMTNTLRFKHAICVNLPKPSKPHGKEIRGSLIAREGNVLCGSDMSSLEDRIKQHFLYEHDPDYVNSLNEEGYDPHLRIATIANMVSEDEVTFYKYFKSLDDDAKLKLNDYEGSLIEFSRINRIRDKSKNANYACQYGAGVARIALTASIPQEEASKLHKAYWDMNWAIKAVARDQVTKEINGQMWLKNPINGFWYSLRFEKDIFSTLVQGTASYVFDLWVGEFLKERYQLTAQFHDEVVLELEEGQEQQIEQLLEKAIARVNDKLQLNKELGVDVAFGKRYSDIH